MNPIGIHDGVTTALHQFILAEGAKLLAEVLALSNGSRRVLFPTIDDHHYESVDSVQQRLDDMMEQIRGTAERHCFDRLLVLFRRIPHQLALDLIHARHGKGQATILFRAAYSEAVLFGTNCILKYSQQDSTFRSNNDRYLFTPTTEELRDSTILFLLCTAHRCGLFLMNSLMRRELVEPTSLDTMLDVYNQRLESRWKPRVICPTSDAIIFAALANSLDPSKRIWRCRDRDGMDRVLDMRNYLPTPCDADLEFRRFEYLDTRDFERLSGIDFSTFSKVWLGLNRVLIETIPMLWDDRQMLAARAELLSARLFQADDYCESALGGAYPESIWESCHEILARDKRSGCPTKSQCESVVKYLTYRQFDGDVRFPEQPFVFYGCGSRLLFWDYLRHAGLMRCLARNLTRQQWASATQNKKGQVLEIAVKAAVMHVPGVSGIRKCQIRDGGRDVWDVDVGFVFHGILILLDAKNEQKTVRYYFEGSEVSGKVAKKESFLDKMDRYLKRYIPNICEKWKDCSPIRGAICLVCTEEAEFIASADRMWWLKLFECPRICLLGELVDFLGHPDAIKELETHAAFVPFHDLP